MREMDLKFGMVIFQMAIHLKGKNPETHSVATCKVCYSFLDSLSDIKNEIDEINSPPVAKSDGKSVVPTPRENDEGE
jgi:hypothetical protein